VTTCTVNKQRAINRQPRQQHAQSAATAAAAGGGGGDPINK